MFEHSETLVKRVQRSRPVQGAVRRSTIAASTEELAEHFRSHFPVLVDGVLPRCSDQGHFIRQARESLARGKVNPGDLPAALLREVLESVKAKAKPSTHAGLTAIGPRRARVWWDATVLDRVDDILASLDKPRLILRFFDCTGLDPQAGRWNESFDIDIAPTEKGKSVDFWAADRSYLVELGVLHADGRFVRLARTNLATLPRESAGTGPAEMVMSNLVPNHTRFRPNIHPDAEARAWIESRPDTPLRDMEAETILHMLYRAFLIDGPRALRHAPLMVRRDARVLEQEFAQRARSRKPQLVQVATTPLLIARLDKSMPAQPVQLHYPPAVALAPMFAYASQAVPLTFARTEALCALARMDTPVLPIRTEQPGKIPDSGLVTKVDPDEIAVTTFAEPVFEAAASLRQRLSSMDPITKKQTRKPAARINRLGLDEARAFAKAGVRIDRMALTLEGRMRPGARLKVAGKLVRADANGRFRLECVLTGGKAAIPMLAGGDARSLINVEWENRPVRERV